MRTFIEILAALRTILHQRDSCAYKTSKAEEDYYRGVLEATNEIKAEIKRRAASDEKDYELQKKKFVWERLALIVATITMVAIIVYACVAQKQLELTR